MNSKLSKTLLAALLAAGAATAQAGSLEFQGVTFTSSWSDNVLTLEIDDAHPSGDWSTATAIGALQIKDIGMFSDVTLLSAPGAAADWTLSSKELNANGCSGGSHAGASLCFSGGHVALTDDMVFKFAFDGAAVDGAAPHVKVNFFDANGDRKVGSLLSAGIAPVPEPQTYAMMLGGLAVLGALARRRRPKR